MEIRNDRLVSHKNTRIFCEDNWEFNAPHHFIVETADTNTAIAYIDFQRGPVKENGINGVANEDLLLMVLARLEGFQMSDYRCPENQEAIYAITEALEALNRRHSLRTARGVEGTSII